MRSWFSSLVSPFFKTDIRQYHVAIKILFRVKCFIRKTENIFFYARGAGVNSAIFPFLFLCLSYFQQNIGHLFPLHSGFTVGTAVQCFNWNFIFSLAIICTEKPIHQINCAANSKLSLAITIENNLIIGAFLCLFCLLRMIENLRSFSTNSVVYVFFSLSPFKRFQFVLTREKKTFEISLKSRFRILKNVRLQISINSLDLNITNSNFEIYYSLCGIISALWFLRRWRHKSYNPFCRAIYENRLETLWRDNNGREKRCEKRENNNKRNQNVNRREWTQ